MNGDGITILSQLINRMAGAQPDMPFLIGVETADSVTFGALRDRAWRWCERFRQSGLAPGDKIAFLLDNGLVTAQLCLSAMYGGFVPVPLNVRAGVDSLAYALGHCDAKVVYVESQYRALLQETLAQAPRAIQVMEINIDDAMAGSMAAAAVAPAAAPGPDDPALLMYTSGSTGQPKAALHSHRTLLACATNTLRAHRLSGVDRSLLVLPLYHINALVVTLVPMLLCGGSVVVPHGFSVSHFWDWLDDYRCTWSALVPTIVSQLLDWRDPLAERRQEMFRRLRFLRSSSAPLSPSLQEAFSKRFPVPLLQAMGSTEAGNLFATPLPPEPNKPGSPGLPTGFEIKLVSREGAEVLQGEIGEIRVRGSALMRGYYKDPTGTTAVVDREGWLHTGDLAFRDSDGYFFIVGRSKELIIKGGMNIAPMQIDVTLESHPAVLEAAAVGVPDRYVGEDIVAFAVLRPDRAVQEVELLRHCESRLGAFKTPTRIYLVSELPKGPSGKVQRLRLQQDAAAGKPPGVEPVIALGTLSGSPTPTGGNDGLDEADLELIIAAVWAKVLKVPRVEAGANFFALGGQSLQAIQCLSRLRAKLGVVLSLSDFFEHPTVAGQARVVSGLRGGAGVRAAAESSSGPFGTHGAIPIPVRDRALPCPLSSAQQRLWFLDRLYPGMPLYNESEAVRLRGRLDAEAMRRALAQMVARHEILRTTFEDCDGEPRAIVHQDWPPEFKRLDLRPLPPEDRGRELDRLLVEEPRRLFQLEAEPALRVTLIELGDEDCAVILMMHHIICDRLSFGVFWRELGAIYAALMEARPDGLEPLPIQYGDYASWQQRPARRDGRRDLDFWKERLNGAPALLELPCDRPRPAVPSYRGDKRQFRLSAGVTRAAHEFSRRERISLFNLFAAMLNTLLFRYTGAEDIVIGIPMAERDRPELQPLIGFLVDTHALRTDLSGNPAFRELLGRVQRAMVDLHAHRGVPFETVVRAVQPQRTLNHSPLFQVVLNWRDRDAQVRFGGFQGFSVEPLLARTATSKFDLALVLTDDADGILLEAEYSTDLFDDSRIERMFGHIGTLIEAAAKDPSRRIVDLPLLPESERRQVLEEWNGTQVEYPADKCVHELFEAQVERTPEATALVFEDASLTYAELNRRANRLAHYLRELGVSPDARVAICIERSLEMVVGLLAILKAGGAYVPLDPAYPPERLRFMLDDSAPLALLTQGWLRDKFADGSANRVTIELDSVEAAWANRPAGNPDPAVVGLTAANLAYVIYTSGSTGQPKGAMNEHRAVVNLIVWMQRTYGLGAADVVLQKTPFSFDGSVWEFFWPLFTGARLVMACPEGHKDVAYLCEAIERYRITTLPFVPSMLAAFVEQGEAPSCASVARVICGGEALPGALAHRFRRWLPKTELYNLYGPTETAVAVTAWECAEVEGDSVPIGRPIANTRIYLLDGHRQPVPVGIAGELYIGGVQVGRGYLNRPELTAERFVPDPFAPESDARMYRTGDLARWRPDGAIEYLGRNDSQVKIRGFRIELGEIEARLAEHAGAREAAVLAREDSPGDKRLVAYYAGEAVVEVEVLRKHLAAKLPEYMVPAAYVRLATLPLTPNGKLDRKALPAPETDAYALRGYEAPQGEVETILAAIWADLLKVERVGRRDHFFELGGHSLLAVRLIERMRQKGLHADVLALFRTPTLAELAAAVGGRDGIVDVPPNLIPPRCDAITPEMLPLVRLSASEIELIVNSVPGGARNVQDIYPLAPLQEGILFHHLMAANGDPYLQSSLFSFDSRARLDGYLAALQAVMDRHDILRTAMAWEGLPDPVQVVWRKAPMPVEEVQFDPAHGDVAGQMKGRFDPRHYRIDVRQAPLIHAYMSHDAINERWLLLLSRHHLSGDHSTVDEMQKELEAHLLGQGGRLPTPLPFRNLVGQARLGMSREEHETFFRNLLNDIGEPTAPFGLLDVFGDGTGIEEARLGVDGDLARRLRGRARKLGVSVASLFHLAWAQVLARVSGREDVVFGTVLLGRMQGGEGSDRVLGPFMNTLPVRIRVGEDGVEANVKATHAQVAELLRHEYAPLALAQRCSAVPAPAPLFSALLNYRHSSNPAQARSATTKQALEGIERLYAEERTNYPFSLNVDDTGQGFSLTAQVAEGIGPLRVCEFMCTALEGLVQALETAPAKATSSIDVLPEAERRRVLEEWNGTQVEYPADKCVHELFEAQVERTPEATALVFEDASLTYAELNRRANRLAHYLRELGVGPDARVAICIERSLEMVVGLLAILKAGGAYVPLDPAYPPERLRFMLDDSAPVALLTQASLSPRFSGDGANRITITLDSAEATWANWPAGNLDPAVAELTSRNLVYVIYTSGSTGKPKGAMNEHRAVVNRLVWMQRAYGLNAADAVLQTTPFSFDVSVCELFWPLFTGARLVMARPEGHKDVQYLCETIQRYGITTMHCVPSMLAAFVEQGEAPSCASLARVICGGEALPGALARRFRRWLPKTELHNLYGPTETAVGVTAWECTEVEGDSVPIGRPIANTRIYILDGHRQPVPVGVAGELHIAGVQVGRGYWNRPEMTAERFVPDPFSGEPEARMYRTGDLARWRPDGAIQYLGRNDFQVKIRGFRIELGEIEARLAEYAGVREAVAVVREDRPGDPHVVAYYTCAGSVEAAQTHVSALKLKQHLAASLPQYMVPAACVRLDALPLLPNGKLDRKALPAPNHEASNGAAHERPISYTEQVLHHIWREWLDLRSVGRRDNFFELGGDSLLTLRVVDEINRTLKVNLRLPVFFHNATIESLARVLESEHQVRPGPQLTALRPGSAEGSMFLLEAGLGLGLCRLAYCIEDGPASFATVAPLPPKSRRSLEELASAHTALVRSRYAKPCWLIGHCLGGLLAFEVARQLESQGMPVETVVLLDARGKVPVRTLRDKLPELTWGKVRGALRVRLERGRGLTTQHLGRLVAASSGALRTSAIPNGDDNPLDPDSVAQAFLWGRQRYRFHPIAARALLFAPADGIRHSQDMGWDGLFRGGIEGFSCPGDHLTMLKAPHLQALARQLDQQWRAAQADGRTEREGLVADGLGRNAAAVAAH